MGVCMIVIKIMEIGEIIVDSGQSLNWYFLLVDQFIVNTWLIFVYFLTNSIIFLF